MSSPENSMFLPQEFQPIIKYKDSGRHPRQVVTETDNLFGLFYKGEINFNPDFAKDYLQGYTIPYLKDAEKGSASLYDGNGMLVENLDLEIEEAAHHALVILAVLPDKMSSPLLPNGFSRRGMLRAPETRDQYLRRIKELKIGVWQIAEGIMKPGIALMAQPSLFRTFAFFRVASELPIREPTKDSLLREFLQG